MSRSSNNSTRENNVENIAHHERKYKGVRRRKWGKWVSEIRIPGTQDRLWLGSYSSAEAAAVAHDVASHCLRGNSSMQSLNFPNLTLPASVRQVSSPHSIQRAASDAGMAIDAQIKLTKSLDDGDDVKENDSGAIVCTDMRENWSGCSYGNLKGNEEEEGLSISVDDYL